MIRQLSLIVLAQVFHTVFQVSGHGQVVHLVHTDTATTTRDAGAGWRPTDSSYAVLRGGDSGTRFLTNSKTLGRNSWRDPLLVHNPRDIRVGWTTGDRPLGKVRYGARADEPWSDTSARVDYPWSRTNARVQPVWSGRNAHSWTLSGASSAPAWSETNTRTVHPRSRTAVYSVSPWAGSGANGRLPWVDTASWNGGDVSSRAVYGWFDTGVRGRRADIPTRAGTSRSAVNTRSHVDNARSGPYNHRPVSGSSVRFRNHDFVRSSKTTTGSSPFSVSSTHPVKSSVDLNEPPCDTTLSSADPLLSRQEYSGDPGTPDTVPSKHRQTLTTKTGGIAFDRLASSAAVNEATQVEAKVTQIPSITKHTHGSTVADTLVGDVRQTEGSQQLGVAIARAFLSDISQRDGSQQMGTTLADTLLDEVSQRDGSQQMGTTVADTVLGEVSQRDGSQQLGTTLADTLLDEVSQRDGSQQMGTTLADTVLGEVSQRDGSQQMGTTLVNTVLGEVSQRDGSQQMGTALADTVLSEVSQRDGSQQMGTTLVNTVLGEVSQRDGSQQMGTTVANTVLGEVSQRDGSQQMGTTVADTVLGEVSQRDGSQQLGTTVADTVLGVVSQRDGSQQLGTTVADTVLGEVSQRDGSQQLGTTVADTVLGEVSQRDGSQQLGTTVADTVLGEVSQRDGSQQLGTTVADTVLGEVSQRDGSQQLGTTVADTVLGEVSQRDGQQLGTTVTNTVMSGVRQRGRFQQPSTTVASTKLGDGQQTGRPQELGTRKESSTIASSLLQKIQANAQVNEATPTTAPHITLSTITSTINPSQTIPVQVVNPAKSRTVDTSVSDPLLETKGNSEDRRLVVQFDRRPSDHSFDWSGQDPLLSTSEIISDPLLQVIQTPVRIQNQITTESPVQLDATSNNTSNNDTSLSRKFEGNDSNPLHNTSGDTVTSQTSSHNVTRVDPHGRRLVVQFDRRLDSGTGQGVGEQTTRQQLDLEKWPFLANRLRALEQRFKRVRGARSGRQ